MSVSVIDLKRNEDQVEKLCDVGGAGGGGERSCVSRAEWGQGGAERAMIVERDWVVEQSGSSESASWPSCSVEVAKVVR